MSVSTGWWHRAIVASAAALLIMSSPAFAEGWVEPSPWSAVTGDGCIGLDGPPSVSSLRLPAVPRADCALVLEHPERVAGRRVRVSATFRTAPGSTANVAALLTQFRGVDIAAHQYETASVDSDGVASLRLGTYVLRDADRVVFGAQSLDGAATVDVKLALEISTDAFVEGAMSDAARVYLDHALRLIVDHAFAVDPARSPSLLHASHAVATGAATVEETYGAIRSALAQLGDRHSRLFTASDLLASASRIARPPYDLERRTIDARIGYVRVLGFASLHEEERAAYARFLGWTVRQALRTSSGDRVDGLVVDLRSDDGGSFVAMLAGMCGLLDRGRSLGGFDDRVGRRLQTWTCATPPTSAATLPIAVLVGPRTASAGEMLAIALRSRAHTVLIGAPTRGFTTDVDLLPLGDGARLALAVGVAVDAHGHAYRAGVVPDVPVPDDAVVDRSSDRAIAEAVAWIDAHPMQRTAASATRQRVPLRPSAAAGISKSG